MYSQQLGDVLTLMSRRVSGAKFCDGNDGGLEWETWDDACFVVK